MLLSIFKHFTHQNDNFSRASSAFTTNLYTIVDCFILFSAKCVISRLHTPIASLQSLQAMHMDCDHFKHQSDTFSRASFIIFSLQIYRHLQSLHILRRASHAFRQYFLNLNCKMCVFPPHSISGWRPWRAARCNGAGRGGQNSISTHNLCPPPPPHHWRWIDAPAFY